MRTLLTALSVAAVVCSLSAQDFNLDLFHVNVRNEVSVNTKHSEFGMVKAIGDQYMFTSDRNKFDNKNEFIGETSFKLYTCIPASAQRTVRPMPVNHNSNTGPATPVNKNVFYYTSTNKKATLNWKEATKTNMLTISKATLVDGKWKVEVIKEFRSTKFSFGQPAISKDGRTLFFVSDMEGGHGDTDLYVSYRTDDDGWTEPENLGATVNTNQKDSFPYIHESGILFFASKGHSGFGGLDLYMTYRTEDGWATPENLGSPINTPADDFSIYLDHFLEHGYFASNRDGGLGGDDIYRFSLTSINDNVLSDNNISVEKEEGIQETDIAILSSEAEETSTNDATSASLPR